MLTEDNLAGCSLQFWVPCTSFSQTVLEGCCILPTPLLPLIQKTAPFLPVTKAREKGCLFTIFVYILNMSYTFKLKSSFGNQKCALEYQKCPFPNFSTLPFLSSREILKQHFQISFKFYYSRLIFTFNH